MVLVGGLRAMRVNVRWKKKSKKRRMGAGYL